MTRAISRDRWRQISQLYHEALELQPNQRAALLERACARDEGLRLEVESLLSQPAVAEAFLAEATALSPAQVVSVPGASTLDGHRIGVYEVQGLLGAGGMGEVYRARDTKLGRDVAIKILPQIFTADADRLARFTREARLLAALNHPHIATIHGLEEFNGMPALVMELVEGPTLAEKLAQGSSPRAHVGLPVADALTIAGQIAEALQATHEKGIIHCDLKPANIKLTREGHAKVLDFGLAKALAGDRSGSDLPHLPTMTGTELRPGAIVGTPAYMSPEQARGQDVDTRTDIWAFGCVLYQMLTGRTAFAGATLVDTLAAIVEREPDWSALPATAHPSVRRLLQRCLKKDATQRLDDIGVARVELNHALKAERASSSHSVESQPSIAVLPFANMSANKENEYFGDGLAEEIINVLAHVPAIRVAGRTSSFFFRGKDVEFGEIGRRLNVDYILEGSVRTAGNRIRVTAQLIKVDDGFHLWSERYDREMTDIFMIQDEITEAISAALMVRLSPEAAAPRRQVPNLRAYAAYLEARDHWVRPTPQSLARVKECLEHSIELDPKFALAYSLLGGHYTMLANLGFRPAREVIPLARAAEQAALRIDPSLPEAHALLGVCAGTDYEWNEAEREWRAAMAREPVSRDVRFWYGNHYLLSVGRVTEAVEAMAAGLQEDPLNVLYRHHYAVGLRHAGRLRDAEAELRRILEIDENFPLAVGTLGAICAQQGRFEEALTLTEKAYALTPWNHPIIGQLASLLVRAGATSRADTLLEKLGTGKVYGAPTGLAVFYALRGELDRAVEWTEHAIEERYPRLVPILGPLLRPSPRWPALEKLMNL